MLDALCEIKNFGNFVVVLQRYCDDLGVTDILRIFLVKEGREPITHGNLSAMIRNSDMQLERPLCGPSAEFFANECEKDDMKDLISAINFANNFAVMFSEELSDQRTAITRAICGDLLFGYRQNDENIFVPHEEKEKIVTTDVSGYLPKLKFNKKVSLYQNKVEEYSPNEDDFIKDELKEQISQEFKQIAEEMIARKKGETDTTQEFEDPQIWAESSAVRIIRIAAIQNELSPKSVNEYHFFEISPDSEEIMNKKLFHDSKRFGPSILEDAAKPEDRNVFKDSSVQTELSPEYLEAKKMLYDTIEASYESLKKPKQNIKGLIASFFDEDGRTYSFDICENNQMRAWILTRLQASIYRSNFFTDLDSEDSDGDDSEDEDDFEGEEV